MKFKFFCNALLFCVFIWVIDTDYCLLSSSEIVSSYFIIGIVIQLIVLITFFQLINYRAGYYLWIREYFKSSIAIAALYLLPIGVLIASHAIIAYPNTSDKSITRQQYQQQVNQILGDCCRIRKLLF